MDRYRSRLSESGEFTLVEQTEEGYRVKVTRVRTDRDTGEVHKIINERLVPPNLWNSFSKSYSNNQTEPVFVGLDGKRRVEERKPHEVRMKGRKPEQLES